MLLNGHQLDESNAFPVGVWAGWMAHVVIKLHYFSNDAATSACRHFRMCGYYTHLKRSETTQY